MNLFAIYTLTPSHKKTTWKYPPELFPGDWEWIGSGGYPSSRAFENEEQFSGNEDKKYKREMEKNLNLFFENLKKNGIVEKYKIDASLF